MWEGPLCPDVTRRKVGAQSPLPHWKSLLPPDQLAVA